MLAVDEPLSGIDIKGGHNLQAAFGKASVTHQGFKLSTPTRKASMVLSLPRNRSMAQNNSLIS